MALNIKNAEVERLAAEAARLARETKTEAIRQALQERVRRLRMHRKGLSRDDEISALLMLFRSKFPRGDFGRKMTRAEKERILGYGPGGI
jgi:antitoxin VapB